GCSGRGNGEAPHNHLPGWRRKLRKTGPRDPAERSRSSGAVPCDSRRGRLSPEIDRQNPPRHAAAERDSAARVDDRCRKGPLVYPSCWLGRPLPLRDEKRATIGPLVTQSKQCLRQTSQFAIFYVDAVTRTSATWP